MTGEALVLDTGCVIALEAADDQHHRRAIDYWRHIGPEYPPIVTTTYVFDECVTFFNGRGHQAKAVEIGERLRTSPRVEVVPETRPLLEAGGARFRNRPDKRYSLTDCLSFVVMNRRDLDRALTFDDHFRQAGFQGLPANGG